MRIQLSERELVYDLLAVLRARADCIAVRDGNAVEAALVGSFADGGERELGRLLAEWQEEHRDVHVEVSW